MGFFDKLFGKGEENPGTPASPVTKGRAKNPAMQFGHYVDANKSKEQLAKWDEAVSLHGKKSYKDAFVAFLGYLGDASVENVTWKYQGSDVHFTMEQGSKMIRGIHNGETVEVVSYLATFEQAPIAVMRQLLGSNFLLRYTKFAIDENKIGIYYHSAARDSSPTKMYHAFKEICLTADRQDDMITEEFEGLTPVDVAHKQPVDEKIAELKYAAWQKWAADTLSFVNLQDKQSFSGIISYSLLNLFYKTDYLLSPQGHFADELNRIQGIYWNKADTRPNPDKNDDLIRNLKQLLEKPKSYFTNSFYPVKATFGLVTAASAQTVADYISDCLKNTDWYVQNRHPQMEAIIYEYTSSYCLFHYGMYPVHYKLFNLHMQIMNEELFRQFGFPVPYITNGNLVPNEIINEINAIIQEEKANFPLLNIITANLKFGSLLEFHYSFLSEIRFLIFSK